MKNAKKSRIIITGAGGFIGSSLAKRLLLSGYKNIITIDRNIVNFNSLKNIRKDFSDEKMLQKILKKDDIVVHLACSSNLAISQKDIKRDVEENIIGSIKLMTICANKKIKKFIYISSGGTVYGNYGIKKNKEKDETNPISCYGAMKVSVENYLKVFSRLYDLNYVIIRPSNPYGRKAKNNKNQGLIDVFLEKISNNEDLEIWGDGKVVRDFLYIEDLVSLIIKTFNSKIKNEIFNAGTGVGTSLREVLDIIKKLIDKKIVIKYTENRSFDINYNVLNIKKAQVLLNWKPKRDLEENIKQILQK